MNALCSRRHALVLLATASLGCGANPGQRPTATPGPIQELSAAASEPIRVTLVQLNDIYEITPVGGGRWGGPARVATLLGDLEAENINTRSVIAGDLFSPSALGTARVDGERLAGRQMVAVLNAMGLDYATFGNHEFDLDEEPFLDRLAESEFEWFSSNVADRNGDPFPGVDRYEILRFAGPGGSSFRLGLIGVTYDGIQPDYVTFTDALEAVRADVDLLTDSVDALIAVTHLPIAQDIALVEQVEGLTMVLGGHEHENIEVYRGPSLTPILKADANVRTLYVHEILFHPATQKVEVVSRLVPITDAIPTDSATDRVVQRWLEVGFAGFREGGFEPDELVTTADVPLDGLEASVRTRPTALTELITRSMLAEVPDADGAILNSGSIRIDDVLPPGPITQYDVIRVLPFGGPVVEVEMRGTLLERVLNQGVSNRGGGGYLQLAGIERGASGTWHVMDRPLDAASTYRIAISDFLLTGREQGLEFLNADQPDLAIGPRHRDIRQTVIEELKRTFDP
jgi:5'-nucleotidase